MGEPMKTFFIFTALLCSSPVAFALPAESGCSNTQYCMSPELNPLKDSARGYVVELKSSAIETSVVLEELVYDKTQKTRTYKTLAELNCEKQDSPANPDQPRTFLFCHDS